MCGQKFLLASFNLLDLAKRHSRFTKIVLLAVPVPVYCCMCVHCDRNLRDVELRYLLHCHDVNHLSMATAWCNQRKWKAIQSILKLFGEWFSFIFFFSLARLLVLPAIEDFLSRSNESYCWNVRVTLAYSKDSSGCCCCCGCDHSIPGARSPPTPAAAAK